MADAFLSSSACILCSLPRRLPHIVNKAAGGGDIADVTALIRIGGSDVSGIRRHKLLYFHSAAYAQEMTDDARAAAKKRYTHADWSDK